jgi:hypothetical protein
VLRGLPGRVATPLGSAGHLALATSRYMFLLFGKCCSDASVRA